MNPRAPEVESKGHSLGRRFAIGDHTHQLGISAKLSIDLSFTAHPLDAGTESQGRDFESQSIARNDRPPKARFLDARKEDQLFITIGNLAQGQNRSALRECFDHEHAWHYRRAGKVTLEKGFVSADLLNANDAF